MTEINTITMTRFLFIYFLTVLCYNTVNAISNNRQDSSVHTVIQGKIPGLNNGQPMSLSVSDFYIGVTYTTYKMSNVVQDESFNFDLSSYDRPVSITFELPTNSKVANPIKSLFSRVSFLVIPNDRVMLTVINDQLIFMGKNAGSFTIQYELFKIKEDVRQKDMLIDFADRTKIKDVFANADRAQAAQLTFLDNHKKQLSPLLYNTLRSNLILETSIEKYFTLNFKKIKAADIGVTLPPEINIDSLYDQGIYFPNNLVGFMYQKLKYDSSRYENRKYQSYQDYKYFKKRFTGKLRDYLLVYPIMRNLKSDSLAKYTMMALQDVQDEPLKRKLREVTAGILENQPVEDFSFKDVSGNEHRLSDYKGKVILMDFWFTGCSGCAQITPYLSDVAEKFKDENVIFLSISIDKEVEVWKKSLKNGTYSFPNSIKLFTSTLGSKHPVIEKLKIIGYPTLIVLDKERKLARAPIDPRKDNGEDLIGLLKEKLK